MKKSLVTLAANCHCCFMTGSVHNCFHFLHSCRFMTQSVHNCFHFLHSCRFMTESVHNCFPFLHSCRFMTKSVHNCFHFLHSYRFMTQSVHNCFHFLHSCRFVLTFWHIWQSKVSRFRKTSCILNCKNYQIIIQKNTWLIFQFPAPFFGTFVNSLDLVQNSNDDILPRHLQGFVIYGCTLAY